MSTAKIKVVVDDFLEEIMLDFINGIEKEILKTEIAFDKKDFSIIAQFGHKLKGNAPCYGLDELGKLGNQIEALAQSQNLNDCQELIAKIKDYLERLEIEYIKK